MAMSPRLLRPKATGTAVPQFSEQGYSRLWCLTTKSSGNVSGSASSDTGYYAVKWWDNTTTVYDSGDPFSKAAAGNQRAFEVYPCDSGGVASGQFDGFDVSDNSLTQVRAEDVSLEDGVAGGWITWWSYQSGSPAETGDISSNNLSSVALDQFYADLDAGGGDLFVSGNPGIDADDPTIATAKGYTVFGSVPPGTALLLNFNGTNGSTTFTDSSPNGLTVTANGAAALSTAESKFGGASLYLPGGNDFASVSDASLAFDSDWTLECWFYATVTSGFKCLFHNSSVGAEVLRLYVVDGALVLRDNVNVITHGAVSADQWHHAALVRSGGVYRIYLDGVQSSGSHSQTATTNSTFLIGGDTFSAFDQHWNGYIDDVRFVSNAALYTANFTPPTSQLGVYP